jgi:hypothetical protein
MAQIIRLIRTVQEHGTMRTASVYLLTSFSPRQATPERLLVLIRGHWSVESRHWLRAVTFGEDRSRLRSGATPQIMAALRNLVLTLIRRTGTTQIAAYRQHSTCARVQPPLSASLCPRPALPDFSQTLGVRT